MTSEMMFHAKAVLDEERLIRRQGLERLRRKVFEKIQRYHSSPLPKPETPYSF